MLPILTTSIAKSGLEKFAKDNGLYREDLSKNNTSIYELDIGRFAEFNRHQDEIMAAIDGTKHLPEIMIIGLVSTYDAFLGNMLRVIFKKHNEIVLTSEKSVKFSELSKFSSIEEARNFFIDKEIDSILRESHYDQFDWMQEKFGMKLKRRTRFLAKVCRNMRKKKLAYTYRRCRI